MNLSTNPPVPQQEAAASPCDQTVDEGLRELSLDELGHITGG